MISNYEEDAWGVVHQQQYAPFVYNKEYVAQRYLHLPNQVQQMSHLRLGYMIGCIGHVPSKILDVGFGTGDFLKACHNLGMCTVGCDLYQDYLPDHSLFVQHPCEGTYDVVTFFDSLEHFEDIKFMKNLNTKHVVISLPWCHDPHDDEWFQNWKHRRPDEHLHHFNHVSLRAWMADQGFQCINYCNMEDAIRGSNSNLSNILTASFVRK